MSEEIYGRGMLHSKLEYTRSPKAQVVGVFYHSKKIDIKKLENYGKRTRKVLTSKDSFQPRGKLRT